MELSEAASLARGLMNDHGLGHWVFQWDRALTRLGACRYRTETISLSEPLVSRAPLHIVHNTILHEIAHALVGKKHGHDRVWKAKARELGCDGDRCFDFGSFEQPPARWRAHCPSCGRKFEKHKLVRPTAKRWCKRCGETAGQIQYQRVG